MEFKQLEAFTKVIEHSSFSKAAEILYLSQPSISSYINILEGELKCQLIYRSTKEVLPTKTGKILYEYAKNILLLKENAIFAVKSVSYKLTGELAISASSVPSQFILPNILSDFHNNYNNIAFNTEQTDSEGVIKNILSHKSEIGLVGAITDNQKCIYEPFCEDKLVVILPNLKKYELFNDSNLVNIFKSEYFVARENGSGTRIRYEELLKSIGIKKSDIKVSATFSDTQSIINSVSKGLGISIVSQISIENNNNKNIVRTIVPIEILNHYNFFIVHKKDLILSPIAELFIKFIKDYFF